MKNPFTKTKLFFSEMIGELKKASWPDRTELRNSTIVVIVGVVILGLYISVVDFSLFQVVQLFSKWARFGIGG